MYLKSKSNNSNNNSNNKSYNKLKETNSTVDQTLTYGDANNRISSHGEKVLVPFNVIIMQQRNHSGHRREGDVCHAIGLLNIDDGLAHLLIEREAIMAIMENKLLPSCNSALDGQVITCVTAKL